MLPLQASAGAEGMHAYLHDDLEGKSPVDGFLSLEVLQHGKDKIPRQRVSTLLAACKYKRN